MQVNSPIRGPLPSRDFEVVVVGGGIHGMAVARQCAMAGKSTLLLEQHDFGSGATSRAPRAIGDVLPDLERGDFAMARDCLRERDALLVERGHLVKPLPGLVALGPDRRRSAVEVRFGLWLRRKLKNSGGDPGAELQVARLKRSLEPRGAWAVLPFDDAICEFPVRLVAEWLREAKSAGAVARNYCRVMNVSVRDGKVRGVIARDLLTEREQFIGARWVINATGPWVEIFCDEMGVGIARPLTAARNSHLVLQRFRGAPDAAVYTEGADGRTVVLMPWNGQMIFGTSRAEDHRAIGKIHPTDLEIEYLQRSFQKLFPQVEMNIVAAFAGIAAVAEERAFGPRFVRNRSMVLDHADDGVRGLLSVVGGALTTAASAARECGRVLGFKVPEAANSAFLPGRANGVEIALRQWSHAVAGFAGIPEATARAIASWHGGRALCIARTAARDAALCETICPHTSHIVAEAVDVVRHEAAITLSDILLRRVPVALSACWSGECALTAAHRIGVALGWNEMKIGQELAQFEAERGEFLVKPHLRAEMHMGPDRLAA